MRRVWVVRAGQQGQWEQFNLDHGLAGGRFHEVGDATQCRDRSDVLRLVRETHPRKPSGVVSAWATQLTQLRFEVAPGDLVLQPLHARGSIAIGEVTGHYEFRSDAEVPRRHVVAASWRNEVSRKDLTMPLRNAFKN